MADLKGLRTRFSQVQSTFGTFQGHSQEIIRYLMPFRADMIAPEFETEGRHKMFYIFLSWATHALELSAAKIGAMFCNGAIDWFKIRPRAGWLQRHRDRDVDHWLSGLEEMYRYLFEKCGFYPAYDENLLDKLGLGNACLWIGRRPESLLHFEALNIGECYPTCNEYGEVDCLYRLYGMSPRQMQEKFGYDHLSEQVKGYLKSNPDKQVVQVLHAVEPRREREGQGLGRGQMPWAETYLEYSASDDRSLKEGGYNSFPYLWSWFYRPTGQTIGRGPGQTVLPTVRELQQKRADLLEAGARKLKPALLLPAYGYMGPVVDLTADAINFINPDGQAMADKIGAFPSGEPGYSVEELKLSKQEIEAIFFLDALLQMSEKEMTATEFVEVAQEKLQILGPFMGRESQFLQRVFSRTFDVLWDSRALPPPPRALIEAGGGIKLEFTSALAKAMQAATARGILQTMNVAAQVMRVKPEAADALDLEGGLLRFAENSGWPVGLIFDEKQVAQIREQRRQIQQKHEEMAMLEKGAKALPGLGKAIQPGSPLAHLTGAVDEGGNG